MSNEPPYDSELIDCFRHFLNLWAEKSDQSMLAMAEVIAPDVTAIGTGRHEFIYSRDEALDLFKREQQFPQVLAYKLLNITTRQTSTTGIVSGDIEVSVPVEKNSHLIYVRQTAVFEKVKTKWVLIHWHMSVPLTRQANDETFRIEALKVKNQELEQLVARCTVLLQRKAEELEQSTQRLKATQEQLMQKEKMASLGELTAGIAHEIQNPLNFVHNFSEVCTELLEELADEQQKAERDSDLETELLTDVRENLHKIVHHSQRASSIVRSMLEHSRASVGESHPTDLNALVDEYLRLAYHGLRAKDKSFNCQLTTHFDAHLGLVEAIPQDLGRVLLNLYSNAFYAVQQRQQQSSSSYKPQLQVSTSRAEGTVEIRVSDNGMGIPESVKQKIFQPFFTTKPTGEGTGLGLSLSYDIITKGHGGSLTVTSQEGEGTEFRICLPDSLVHVDG
ncbi:SnoaL-like domain-containing protein [Spirosoma taeanense]|uniref:histidine kinase n=1 Tax=Spirosoma taeanense TaxID=2735870 RepID=A0A6M5YDZ8_9BACT|nr:ATP-binding protein [Spirosoma taeanense]QJW91523.1 SnoaL-like domain-containing protein [Spirosoma taeanense]